MDVIERYLPHGDYWPENHPHAGEATGPQTPTLIVIHAMALQIDYQGDRMYAASFLDELGLSAHALVTPDGSVIRCRRDDQVAWHAKGFNQDSLGIEFLVPNVYNYGDWLQRINLAWGTDAQMRAGAELIRKWCVEWPIHQIKGHNQIDPERKQDPGKGFRWGRLTAAIANPENVA